MTQVILEKRKSSPPRPIWPDLKDKQWFIFECSKSRGKMKLEDLNAKKRASRYSKFLTLSPVALPVLVALVAFTASMVANVVQAYTQKEAPRHALILKAVENADQTKTAERLLFLNEAGLIELKPEQKQYLESVAHK